MKKIITTAILTFTICTGFAQTKLTSADSSKIRLDSIEFQQIQRQLSYYQTKTDSLYSVNKRWLVSTYTFRSLIQKDYSKITIGENSFSKVGRFATLNINKDESRFYFTPVTFVRYHDPIKGSFKYIHSIDISGEVNDQNIFDFKSKKSIKAGYSLTKILAGYKFEKSSRNENIHKKIVELAYNETLLKYQKAKTDFSGYLKIADIVEIKDTAERYTAIKKDFFKLLEQYEQKYYEEKWTIKRISWIKLNVIPVSWDNFSYIDPAITATSSAPGNKSVYTGVVKFSYNTLYTFAGKDKQQFYWTIYASLGQKHTLSEISKPSQWYNHKVLTDSTLTVTDDKKVFTLNDAEFKTKIRPDIGGQIIFLFKIANNNIGVDLASSFNGLVTAQTSSFVNRSSAGIVFPFTDKSGDSTINVELFYQQKSFINTNFKNEGFWGIKFGLPFNSL